jgi:hypothetical protein
MPPVVEAMAPRAQATGPMPRLKLATWLQGQEEPGSLRTPNEGPWGAISEHTDQD